MPTNLIVYNTFSQLTKWKPEYTFEHLRTGISDQKKNWGNFHQQAHVAGNRRSLGCNLFRCFLVLPPPRPQFLPWFQVPHLFWLRPVPVMRWVAKMRSPAEAGPWRLPGTSLHIWPGDTDWNNCPPLHYLSKSVIYNLTKDRIHEVARKSSRGHLCWDTEVTSKKNK